MSVYKRFVRTEISMFRGYFNQSDFKNLCLIKSTVTRKVDGLNNRGLGCSISLLEIITIEPQLSYSKDWMILTLIFLVGN